MRGYIGVTDGEWANFLNVSGCAEVNFWIPSNRPFKALKVGEPFLFKSKYPDNRLIGGGFFEHATSLRCSEAWNCLGSGNGVPDMRALVRKVNDYRDEPVHDPDPIIGCIILNDVTFFSSDSCPPGPASFAKNVVSGKGYTLPSEDTEVEAAFRLLAMAQAADAAPIDYFHPDTTAEMFGDARLVRPRLGQGGFRASILDAYGRRCAITGHKITPTLQAAHIRPVSEGGQHRVDNGLLLRSDVHTMFDLGFLTVDPNFALRVSPSLRDEFGNGEEFYQREGRVIALPTGSQQQPNREFLEWHGAEVFRAS
ncbi:MAG: putative restriction endonuclease [Actinomycetota bacterium]|nr:putative restriction endonuclease [Actinomycetota bacterium]